MAGSSSTTRVHGHGHSIGIGVEGVEAREHDGSRVIRVGLSWGRTPRTPRARSAVDHARRRCGVALHPRSSAARRFRFVRPGEERETTWTAGNPAFRAGSGD